MEELTSIQKLLVEIGDLVKSGLRPDRRKAAAKFREIGVIATTMELSIRPRL